MATTARKTKPAKAALPTQETTGALPHAPMTLDQVLAARKGELGGDTTRIPGSRGGASEGGAGRQSSASQAMPVSTTHGAVLPRGPIMSVSQLLAVNNQCKGSRESFDTIQDYESHLNTLSTGELHTHAVEQAKIGAIPDRSRLIKRLLGEYTAVASRIAPKGGVPMSPPKPVGYTQEQMQKMDQLRNQALRRG